MKLPVNLQPTPRKPKKIEHGKEPKMSEQWEEIKIEDVQPGDVARCNGREFPVEFWAGPQKWKIQIGNENFYPDEPQFFAKLGITFHRKVNQPPQSFELTLTNVSINVSFLPGVSPVTRSNVTLPGVYPRGARFRVELLDGEDGA